MMMNHLRERLSKIFGRVKALESVSSGFSEPAEASLANEQNVVRPASIEDLKALAQALQVQGVDYLLIGGYALHALGYQRTTTDIDLVLRPNKEQGMRLKKALLSVQGSGIEGLDPAWFEEGDTIRVAEKFTVDLMFNACGQSFDSLLPFRQTLDLDGVAIHSLTVEGLLKTKLSSREKDVQDRLILERALQAWKNKVSL